MSFDLTNIGGYGSGELGDVEICNGAVQNFNSYARVTAINGNTVTIDTGDMIEGAYETFRAGNDILIHVSANNNNDATDLGKYMVAQITLVSNGVLTLNKNMFAVDLRYNHVQAVTFANFDCLTLGEGAVVTVPPFNPFKFIGGILAVKCWDTLRFGGGHIDLRDCGIPANRKNTLRPLTNQETPANGEGDNALYAGWENHLTAASFLLNAGDGAAFVVAKNVSCDEGSRIGNPETHGAQFCRGAANSVGVKPSNITNIGGSSILIVADTIANFTPKLIAKYRTAYAMDGRGLSRCYIASNTKLRNDEGLYAYDSISDVRRVQEVIGVKDFGSGSFGTLNNPTIPLNNYARVTEINRGGHRLSYEGKTRNGLAPINTGALVLVQVIQRGEKNVEAAGKIVVARVLKDDGRAIIVDKAAENVDLDSYYMQIISVPELSNLTLTINYDATPKFNGVGGVFAVAVSDTLDIRGGKINVMGIGGAPAYGRAGLSCIGNAQDSDKLPLGSGHGSVFVMAKNIITDANTRIGATYSGEGTGGRFGGSNSSGTNQGGGYAGAPDEDGTGSGGGYNGGGAGSINSNTRGLGGSGAHGGTNANMTEYDASAEVGGYGGGRQGAHILIIADNIDNLAVANISTGGSGGIGVVNGVNGGAGYGGGGALNGSDGGSSGWAFVYSNS